MSQASDVYIFHEVQDSMLCGQHALNNLLQESIFTPVDLGDIAQGLDEQERRFMMEGGTMTPDALKFLSEGSGNVDESGNFSIQVLRAAIQQSHGIELSSYTANNGSVVKEMTAEQGFIVNRSSHWFTVRKIKNRWWNLNSTLEFPEPITEFYLTAFLSQLIGDGYTVFIAKGNVPTAGSKSFGSSSGAAAKWYTEKELLAKSGKAPEVFSFPGEGRRLTERKPAASSGVDTNDPDYLYAQALRASEGDIDYEDDPELALAIALSKSDATTSAASNSTSTLGTSVAVDSNPKGLTGDALVKEQMRQKRLEALNKRGL